MSRTLEAVIRIARTDADIKYAKPVPVMAEAMREHLVGALIPYAGSDDLARRWMAEDIYDRFCNGYPEEVSDKVKARINPAKSFLEGSA